MTMDDVTITYPGIISHKSLSFHPTPASITQDVEDRCRKRYEFFQKFSIFFFFLGFWLGVPHKEDTDSPSLDKVEFSKQFQAMINPFASRGRKLRFGSRSRSWSFV